jgi:zinc/manganese transport system permease protein
MMEIIHVLFPPGLFQSSEVTHALLVGSLVAVLSGVVGVFVILRGQSFVGHVLTDMGTTGASGAYLLGINAWYGFLAFGLLAGFGVEVLGERPRIRDVATGILLSFVLGLGSLFLYLDTKITNNANVSLLVLFGSVFTLDPAVIPSVASVCGLALLMLLAMYRPLLLSSIHPEMAKARGVPVRWVGMLFMLVLAVTVEAGCLVVGALISTALLIGPAAIAVRFITRLGWVLFTSAVIGMASTCTGIVLSYDSYEWPPYGHGWPVSFFIAFIIFLLYLFSSAFTSIQNRRGNNAKGEPVNGAVAL